jgi:hypothetical protein
MPARRKRTTFAQDVAYGLCIGVVVGGPIGVSIGYFGRPYFQHLQNKTHYRLMVDPAFTPQQQMEVSRAAHKWEKAVGDRSALTISVQVGECPGLPNVIDACIIPTDKIIDCRPASDKAVGCTRSDPRWFYQLVQIDVMCGDLGTFSHIAQHEIGHTLGLEDSDTKGVVMHRYTVCGETQGDASQDVSQSDARRYLKEKE